MNQDGVRVDLTPSFKEGCGGAVWWLWGMWVAVGGVEMAERWLAATHTGGSWQQ